MRRRETKARPAWRIRAAAPQALARSSSWAAPEIRAVTRAGVLGTSPATFNAAKPLTRSGVPQLDFVAAPRHPELAVRRECDGVDISGRGEVAQGASGRDVPEHGRPSLRLAWEHPPVALPLARVSSPRREVGCPVARAS